MKISIPLILVIFSIASHSYAFQTNTNALNNKKTTQNKTIYPCNIMEDVCPPPPPPRPPIMLPKRIFDACADQEVGKKFTWLLNKNGDVISGSCQKRNDKMTFVPNSERKSNDDSN
jgi:hypothetical protein